MLNGLNPVTFEINPSYPLKLSLEMLESDQAIELIRKVRSKQVVVKKITLPAAAPFSDDFNSEEKETEIIIDLESLKNSFTASGRDLFDFVMQYDYPKEIDFGQKVTIYCQLISLYPDVMDVTDRYLLIDDLEYVIVNPK